MFESYPQYFLIKRVKMHKVGERGGKSGEEEMTCLPPEFRVDFDFLASARVPGPGATLVERQNPKRAVTGFLTRKRFSFWTLCWYAGSLRRSVAFSIPPLTSRNSSLAP